MTLKGHTNKRWFLHEPPKKRKAPCDPYQRAVKGFTQKKLDASLDKKFPTVKK